MRVYERARARAWRWALRRFNERYYDLVALDITHINPRGTLILKNLELSQVVSRASKRSYGEFINRSRKKKLSPLCAEEGWSHASGSDERELLLRREKLRDRWKDFFVAFINKWMTWNFLKCVDTFIVCTCLIIIWSLINIVIIC